MAGLPASRASDPAADLPRLREDLSLHPGPAHRDGSPSWRIHDPIRNAFFEIGWLEFELLARWRGQRDGASLLKQVAAETPLAPAAEELRELIEFLAAHQLLAPEGELARGALRRKWSASRLPWYERLLHHYLFFRLPLVKPDAFLARTAGLTEIFATRGFALLVLMVFCADLVLVAREWHEFAGAFVAMLTPAGLLYYALALSFAKVVHELGHAYAARRYGVRVHAMGIAFLVLWPYLYTDVGETWKLADRRKQFVIAAAGMAAEATLAVFATLAWALAPEGGVKAVLFALATSTWLLTLAINASPFMRFDGYFLLSDALDFPNLHERASACARWWIRGTFFRLDEPVPEPALAARHRAWLVAFALATWAYRLVVFLAIALLIYFLFFKLLGIVLMVLEIGWFVARPVWREAGYLWERRRALRPSWAPLLALAVLGAFVAWLVPVSSEVSAPALLRAGREQAVYAPFPARVSAIAVNGHERVEQGAPLMELEAPDLKAREQLAEVGIASAQIELERTPASARQQERRAVLEQQLAQAHAAMRSVHEDAARQRLHAAHAGTVRDLQRDVVPGQWVNPRTLLMRVVQESEPLIEAYVSERQLDAIKLGQRVWFYPSLPEAAVIEGEVAEIDRTPIREIPRPILASVHGGDIVTVQASNGALLAHEAVFRVILRPRAGTRHATAVVRGTARIEADLRFVAENFLYRTLSLVIRESGF